MAILVCLEGSNDLSVYFRNLLVHTMKSADNKSDKKQVIRRGQKEREDGMFAKLRVKSIRKIALGILSILLVVIFLSLIYLKNNVVSEPKQDERISNLLKHTETLTLLEKLYGKNEELEIVNENEGIKVEKGKITEDEKTRLRKFFRDLGCERIFSLKEGDVKCVRIIFPIIAAGQGYVGEATAQYCPEKDKYAAQYGKEISELGEEFRTNWYYEVDFYT